MHIHKKNAKKSFFLYRMLPMGGKVYGQEKKMTAVGQSFFVIRKREIIILFGYNLR